MLASLLPTLPVLTPPLLLAVVTACCAAVTDLYSRTISNNLILAALITALLLHLLGLPWPAALRLWSTGALTGLALFLPLYLLRGMAAGDVKLLAALGAFVGPQAICKLALASCLAGGAMAIAMIVFNGKFQIAWRHIRALLTQIMSFSPAPSAAIAVPTSAGSMPYALAIAVGTLYIAGGGA